MPVNFEKERSSPSENRKVPAEADPNVCAKKKKMLSRVDEEKLLK